MLRKALLKAPAKINLYLEVGPRRADGYHRVRTVLQAVEWFDLVELEVEPGGRGISLEVEGEAPTGEDNLCHRAAELFLEAAGISAGVRIKLTKDIPVAAGLGGGSSDAAAVLRGLDYLTGAGLGGENLFRLASRLGSDVPFFLLGGTVLGEGRGEVVTPAVQAPSLPVVLANPGKGLSTAEVYRRFDLLPAGEPPAGGPRSLLDSLAAGDVGGVAAHLYNALQEAACALLPELAGILIAARRTGAPGVLLSGSGPTVFMLASGPEEAELIASRIREAAPVVRVTRFCSHGVVLEEWGS
ncbi:4-(cytidine 5'-diphospho)-2-C-methyl-D-erythritol kinase [Candidatus Solincola sp.]|nr:4-(cytidine 5'-diphospho)-2-C-methyl-D-erythritol kinase [Actinomycetota bacterium]